MMVDRNIRAIRLPFVSFIDVDNRRRILGKSQEEKNKKRDDDNDDDDVSGSDSGGRSGGGGWVGGWVWSRRARAAACARQTGSSRGDFDSPLLQLLSSPVLVIVVSLGDNPWMT